MSDNFDPENPGFNPTFPNEVISLFANATGGDVMVGSLHVATLFGVADSETINTIFDDAEASIAFSNAMS